MADKVVIITSRSPIKAKYVGRIGVVERVNSYSGIDRYFIPSVCEDLYFFEEDFSEVNLKELSAVFLDLMEKQNEEEMGNIIRKILRK